MKKIVIGILAHVDAGKTTLSESMLYLSGKIRKMGRVDNKDAYLDTYALEKERGITIFSKQALFDMGDVQVTLLDTPGHVDFSSEMERTLQVLDYAILVVSGAEGVQGHTKTLWRLLEDYNIPTFLFLNKMDQNGTDKHRCIEDLNKQLSDMCVYFDTTDKATFLDTLAMCHESFLEIFLETGTIPEEGIREAIAKRKLFPCYFGSALKLQGIDDFMEGLQNYISVPNYPSTFGAKVYKIGRDEQGNRLTFMKLTGGSMKVKSLIQYDEYEEKVNQIRLYSGQKYETVGEIEAGRICAVTGLTKSYPGQGLGSEPQSHDPLLQPVLYYRMVLEDGCDPKVIHPKLKEIEEEDPALHIVWDEQVQEIHVQIMGDVQIEILQSLIKERIGIDVHFSTGSILYRETIVNTVVGVGHFEPLRHYAEVHLLMEPNPRGYGVTFEQRCSEDLLDKNWQRLILSHLKEKTHKGVCIGVPITDVKITLVAGRGHKKHTAGGDFREATYRAVRQGLKQAESIILEPYYSFQLELPEKLVGRAMTDIEKMYGQCEVSEILGENALLVGTGPVATMRNYQKEVYAYTKGMGHFHCVPNGYAPCHNAEAVINDSNYDSERDIANPTGSVFCAHGTGFLVNWDEVDRYMHIEHYLKPTQPESLHEEQLARRYEEEKCIGLEEIDKILKQTAFANQGEKTLWRKNKAYSEPVVRTGPATRKLASNREACLLIDGYNIIFAWEELKQLADENMDSARIKLLDTLSHYQGIRKCKLIVVFDAYRVKGNLAELTSYQNIYVVYTKEAQTADHYIEKFVHKHIDAYDVTVATSDRLEQVIIRSQGGALLSARELKEDIEYRTKLILDQYREKQTPDKQYMSEFMTEDVKAEMLALIHQKPTE